MKIICSPICKRCVRIIHLYVDNVRPLRANIINYPFGEVDTINYAANLHIPLERQIASQIFAHRSVAEL